MTCCAAHGSTCNGTFVARNGHGRAGQASRPCQVKGRAAHLTWGFSVGAGEGNRTLMTGLEDRCCGILPDQD